MNKKPQKELQLNTKQQGSLKISAKRITRTLERLSQGDIFQDLEIIEHLDVKKSIITVKKISFPFTVCLNQECDLETDFINNYHKKSDNNLLHISIAPAFLFEQFLNGAHWGGIFNPNNPQKRKDTTIKKIIDNEIPRYHYLKFPDPDIPELIIDFKHFFSINRDEIYNQLDKRLCSLDDLFREKINQRFSYYISRIGLPEYLP
jgi:hypothetical protein